MQRKVWVVAAVMMACMVSPAQAQTISYAYTSDATNYTGNNVTVNLYLSETLIGGAPSIIGPSGSEYGLTAGLVTVNLVSGTATITSVSLNNNSYNAAAPGFGNAGQQSSLSQSAIYAYNGSSGGTAALLNSVGLGNSSQDVPAGTFVSNVGGVITNSIYLGAVTISGLGKFGATFSITGADNAPTANTLSQQTGPVTNTSGSALQLDLNGSYTYGDPTTVSWSGTDNVINTFSVNPSSASTPEPSSVLLCGLAISGLGIRAWRRRGRGQATKTEPATAI